MPNDRLRLVLRLNAVSSLLTGLLLVAGADVLAGPMGDDPTLLRAAGVFLVPFSLLVGWLSARAEPEGRVVAMVSACDFAWVAGSLYFVLATPLTVLGKALVLAVALVVEVFGSLQLLYAHRRERTASFVRG